MIGNNKNWHIAADGTPRRCYARYCCPFGGINDHFATFEEAQKYADEINEKRASAIDSLEGVSWHSKPNTFPSHKKTNFDYDNVWDKAFKDTDRESVKKVKAQIESEIADMDKRIDFWKEHQNEEYKTHRLEKHLSKSFYELGSYIKALKAKNVLDTAYAGLDSYYYDTIKKGYIAKYNKNMNPYLEKHYLKNKTFFNRLLRKYKYYVEIEPIFTTENVDLKRYDNKDIKSVNMLIKEANTGKLIERRNMTDEECKKLGCVRPNSNMIEQIFFHGDEIKNSTYHELRNIAQSNYNDIKNEEKEEKFLELRRESYKKILKEIKDNYNI